MDSDVKYEDSYKRYKFKDTENESKWIGTDEYLVKIAWKCSKCKGLAPFDFFGNSVKTRYCPHCGRKMVMEE